MGRPREFEIDDVLDAAMDTFWQQGYEATSLSDLIAATGLQKGSLYKAFQSKRALFICALKRYIDKANAFHRQYLASGDAPKAQLTQWFHTLINTYGGDCNHRGCFATNCLIELAPHDGEVRQLLQEQTRYLQLLLQQAIATGQHMGEFRTDLTADDLSMVLIHVVNGIVSSSKGAVPLDHLKHQVDIAIALLE